MFNLYTLMETADKATGSALSWEVTATILGVVALILETIIRIYMHNSKMKKEENKAEAAPVSATNSISLTDAEIMNLKNLAQSVINNTNKISNIEIQNKNYDGIIDEIKKMIRDNEKEHFTSLNNVSDKVDVLKNILLEAKMNKDK